MAATNQEFSVYQGDDIEPTFTVRNAAGAPVDISSVSDIQWIGYLSDVGSPLVSKKMSLGEITFVTNGADGQLRVDITKADSAAMSWGWYFHSCIIDDAEGETTTVSTGRFAILTRGNRS